MSSSGSQLFNFGTNNTDMNGLFMGSGTPGTSGAPNMGSNQYGSFPTLQMGTNGMAGGNTPGTPSSVQMPTAVTSNPSAMGKNGARANSPMAPSANSQYYAGGTLDPALTQQLFSFLQGQIGQGVPAFNWSSILPSSGGATAPGQLTAPQNQLLQSLMSSFSQPGGAMNKMTQTGDPTAVGPAWEAMKSAEQQNIQQNQAQLREGMNLSGNLAGSPMGTAMSNYEQQTTKDQNANLTQAQMASQESAKGRMLTASQMQEGLSKYIQGLDQSSIDRLYQEFQRVSPQNNPLLQQQMQAATTMPQYLQKKSGGSGLQSLLGALGPMAGAGLSTATQGGNATETITDMLGAL